MAITVDPALETKLRANAAAEGISVEQYLERLVKTDKQALTELESLAIEGIDSGDPIEPGPDYWEEKHRKLNEFLNSGR
jgi:hypothetical protein